MIEMGILIMEVLCVVTSEGALLQTNIPFNHASILCSEWYVYLLVCLLIVQTFYVANVPSI